MTDQAAEHDGPKTFDEAPQIGVVELDRYCTGCGYNLRQQIVRREPVTRLLLCRCPECGAFEPANQATTAAQRWFAQLILLFWVAWIACWIGLVAGAIGIAVELSNETTQLTTESYKLDEPVFLDPRPGEKHSRTINYEYRMQAMDLELGSRLAIIAAGTFLVGAGLIGLSTVMIPHWKRRSYIRLAVAWPVVALVIMFITIASDNYTLEAATQSLKLWLFLSAIILAHLAVFGGLAAVWLGRPTARWLVRMMIPPRRRGPFAFLWLADGKDPPSTQAG